MIWFAVDPNVVTDFSLPRLLKFSLILASFFLILVLVIGDDHDEVGDVSVHLAPGSVASVPCGALGLGPGQHDLDVPDVTLAVWEHCRDSTHSPLSSDCVRILHDTNISDFEISF